MADQKNGNPIETEELSVEDYAIIAAGLFTLGQFFTFLSVIKAKQVIKESGGTTATATAPAIFIQSRTTKKKSIRKPR